MKRKHGMQESKEAEGMLYLKGEGVGCRVKADFLSITSYQEPVRKPLGLLLEELER